MGNKRKIAFSKFCSMVMVNDEYMIDNLIDDINHYIDTDIDPPFKYKDDEIFMNIRGACILLLDLNLEPSDYLNTLEYMNKKSLKRNLTLNNEMDVSVTNCPEIKQKEIKKFIKDTCLKICTNGKVLNDEEIRLLSNKDIKTMNKTMRTYEKMIKAGHKSNAERLFSAYKHVNDKDPNIVLRMLYLFDYDFDKVLDYVDRYNFMEFEELRKSVNNLYRTRKRKENKSKQKNKKS